MAFRQKPDLRNLLPLFAVCHIRSYYDSDQKQLENTALHSTSAILVGRSEHSPSPLFYHPSTGRTIISDDYYVDETLPAGPAFNLPFQGRFHFHAFSQLDDKLCAPTYIPQKQVFVLYNNKFEQARIITLPAPQSNIYTVQISSDKSLHQYDEKNIFKKNPDVTVSKSGPDYIYFPSWIKSDCTATFSPPGADKPQHGKLLHVEDKWYFRPGRSDRSPAILLPDFHHKAFHLQQELILFKGRESFKEIHALRQSAIFSNIFTSHVSAHDLTSSDVPTLLQLKKLSPKDRSIWIAASREEYDGLINLSAWITITEDQYNQIKHKVGKPLPTMAVSTIKHDENGLSPNEPNTASSH